MKKKEGGEGGESDRIGINSEEEGAVDERWEGGGRGGGTAVEY